MEHADAADDARVHHPEHHSQSTAHVDQGKRYLFSQHILNNGLLLLHL